MTAANPPEGTDMHLPYATTASGETLSWNIFSHAAGPHCLIVGPTGGGKTSVIRTPLTEAARRGIPFVGIDPKATELDGLETEPNCVTIIGDALDAAELIRALHREMHARLAWVQENRTQPTELQPLIVAVDEFFILSGKWQRLAKTGDDETRAQLKELDPLGAWADLAVLARSAGIRLLLGVQRPDASLFGGASGNARDNFGTRISLGNLSQDGALMMWGDSTVGREVDTSVKGRGVALGDDGRPTAEQIRTPEQAPAETTFTPMTWYSRELPNFLDNAFQGD
ncbi:cell division protein FtsK (plasmid) [Rhodococcus koreensis]|nr:cell division protein FtsK [Rhodococcus koreensis]